MNRTTKIVLAIWVVALIAAGAWVVRDSLQPETAPKEASSKGFFSGEKSVASQIGGPFTLDDQDGKRRSDTDFRGKLMMVYFGYTYCPDVCPTTLTVMATALDQLGAEADQVAPIFVTIDPDRDTPKVLKDYVAQFSNRLVGLTGTAREIAAMAKAYRVYYAKVPGTDGAPYLMDHTSLIYLMGRDGHFITHFTHNNNAEDIAKGVRTALAQEPATQAADAPKPSAQ